MANKKKKEVVHELPDGRKLCCRTVCLKYKGRSFFTINEWKKKGFRICRACQQYKNDEYQQQQPKIAGGGADIKRKDFNFSIKK